MDIKQPKEPLTATFICDGRAVGKMRNELDVTMTEPMVERFVMATDEGPFHGGGRQRHHRLPISSRA